MLPIEEYDYMILKFIEKLGRPVGWYSLRYRNAGPYKKITKALDALEEKGLLVRVSDEPKGLDVLTEAGKQFLEVFHPSEKMDLFGRREEFAIEYRFEIYSGEEFGVSEATWGTFRLWVQGHDICSFSIDDDPQTYQTYLFMIFEWFCKNLEDLLKEDPFPVPVTGRSAVELLGNSRRSLPQDDHERDALLEKIQEWELRHSWRSAQSKATPARVYFRRVEENQIEICWDSSSIYTEYAVQYDCPKGLSWVSLSEFTNVVGHFLNDFSNKLSKRFPEYTEVHAQFSRLFPQDC